VLQFKVQGRGGQGAQMAGEVLAEAFFAGGSYVQAFSSYGGARRGTPVLTAIRVDDKPIRLRSDIDVPDAIVIFDSSLLGPAILAGAEPGKTVVLVNSQLPPEAFKKHGDYVWYTVDGIAIARKNNLGRIVNSAVLGAFARIVGKPDMETLVKTVFEVSPVKKAENAQAARDGYEAVVTAGEQAA
jgi:pyruvate ferredoxin oxidoreductase gamma subunit